MSVAIASEEGLVRRLVRWCTSAIGTLEEARLLASLDDETAKHLAADVALSAEDIRMLVRKGPRAADEMLALMKALKIDAEEFSLMEPQTYRQMHVSCASCGEKTRCRRELASGDAMKDFAGYCRNAPELDEARRRSEFLSA